MSETQCTRCNGTGFLNIDQVPEDVINKFYTTCDHNLILIWIKETQIIHDVQICDCCGDGNYWYGNPGQHDEKDYGLSGSYAYNGGLPECY